MIIRATERDEEELKERAERAPPVAVRIIGRRDEAKADMVWLVFGILAFEQVLGIRVGESREFKKWKSNVNCFSQRFNCHYVALPARFGMPCGVSRDDYGRSLGEPLGSILPSSIYLNYFLLYFVLCSWMSSCTYSWDASPFLTHPRNDHLRLERETR